MTIKNLSETSFDDLLDCFLLAFENYYVTMPSDKNYYQQRWKAAKVDFRFSYGMFDKGKLVGFIIHAVDERQGVLTVFNTGTGVIPAYRGRRIVHSIYQYALQDLYKNGIQKSTLEVITENKRAIRAYESVGFKICKKYMCYAGDIKIDKPESFELKEIPLKKVDWKKLPRQEFYSWDFQKETILEGNYSFFQVLNNNKSESFFIINIQNNYLAQFGLLNDENIGWGRLFSAIKNITDKVKIINIDKRLKERIEYIKSIELKNTVNQYEMELMINKELL